MRAEPGAALEIVLAALAASDRKVLYPLDYGSDLCGGSCLFCGFTAIGYNRQA